MPLKLTMAVITIATTTPSLLLWLTLRKLVRRRSFDLRRVEPLIRILCSAASCTSLVLILLYLAKSRPWAFYAFPSLSFSSSIVLVYNWIQKTISSPPLIHERNEV